MIFVRDGSFSWTDGKVALGSAVTREGSDKDAGAEGRLLVFVTEYLEGCVFEAISVDAGECDVFNVRDECFVP